MPKQQRVRNPKLQRILVHGLRIALFVCVLWMIRHTHRQAMWADSNLDTDTTTLEFVQQSIPEAASIGPAKQGMGGNLIADESGETVGYVLQTSPLSDHIIGYSGPTNCLIALDSNNEILSIAIRNSGDTVDHVAAVKNDPSFAGAFRGIGFGASDRWQEIDAVSGATLTSYSIISSVANRMGGSAPSLKFDAKPIAANVRLLFDTATRTEATWRSNIWDVYSQSDRIGFVMTTTPYADQLSGYQGPTVTLAGFDVDEKCVGLIVDQTYENQPYANYLNDELSFQTFYIGKTLKELATMVPEDNGIDGVSGATMTSMCVADGLVLTAKATLKQKPIVAGRFSRSVSSYLADIATVLLTLFGVVLSFGRFGKYKKLRIVYQLAVIVFLGFINGHMLSQASIVGWSTNSIPWTVAPGLVLLSLAAFAVPIVSKHQPYCHHICPFGAIQQLTRKRIKRKLKIPKPVDLVLGLVPFALLFLVVVVALTGSNFNLASIEPFDGFAFRVAGWATIGLFAAGLCFSFVSPMAYCRYGCPTGALLGFLRFRSDSHRIGLRDWAAMLLLATAFLLSL